MDTFTDLLDRLKREDEVTLLEILDLGSDELVDALEDVIYNQQEKIRVYYGEGIQDMDGEEE